MSMPATTRWGSDPAPLRVGVVCDSHVGEHLPRLPGEILELLEGCDVIVHAGDITDPAALDQLRAVAPVLAVRGDHDRALVGTRLPRDLVLEIGGRRIGVTHGDRSTALEYLARILTLFAGRLVDLGLDRALLRRFGPVDAIVYGHLHLPRHRRVGGTLIFSPGAAYTVEHDGNIPWIGVAGRATERFRARLRPTDRRAAVGVIEVDRGRLVAHRLPLAGLLRSPASA